MFGCVAFMLTRACDSGDGMVLWLSPVVATYAVGGSQARWSLLFDLYIMLSCEVVARSRKIMNRLQHVLNGNVVKTKKQMQQSIDNLKRQVERLKAKSSAELKSLRAKVHRLQDQVTDWKAKAEGFNDAKTTAELARLRARVHSPCLKIQAASIYISLCATAPV